MIKKRLIQSLSHAKKYIVWQVVFQWLALLCQIAVVWATVTLLCSALAGELSQSMLVSRGVVFCVAVVLKYVFDRVIARMSYLASVDVKRTLREKLYSKLLRLGASYRERVSTAELTQLSVEGVEQLETYFGRFLPQFFYSLLAPLTLFAILAFVNMKASVVLLICVPLLPASIVAVQKIAKRFINKYLDIYHSLGSSFLENLQGMTTLKIYRADEKKAEDMDAESETFRKVTMKVLTMQLNSTSVMDIMAYGGAAIGMAVTIAQFAQGKITLTAALMTILLASEFFIPLRILGSFFHIAMNGMSASDRIFAFLDTPEPEQKTETLTDEPISIHLENVGFAYTEKHPVLRGVSLDLPAGSFTSLVGLSGCGKSTIAGILMGRNKGYTGSITVQGRELRDLNEESLMRHITLVTHSSTIFKGTVRDNLLLGNPDADDAALLAALEQVNLRRFVEAQDGLDTEIAERGSNLSGGQCQRLALARALLHDTPVYIFDEATSNIDVESEELIMQVIHKLAKERTVLLISHRLANVVPSDRIYFLEDGAITEQGDHAALLQKNGAYADLFQTQRKLEAYAAKNAARVEAETAEPAPVQTAKTAVKEKTPSARRSGAAIMGRLIGLVKPLLPVMLLAIFLGVVGYLCAISLTILASHGVVLVMTERATKTLTTILIVVAVARGLLHYGEQYCNHFIAFKLLAIIRHKVFAVLRRLCPAKLEGRDRGDLISILTADIELLEVFYAHTISPIAIAVIVSVIMLIFIGTRSLGAALIALCGYLAVGLIVPLWNGRRSAAAGMSFRERFGEMNSFMLESLRGLDETIQYGHGAKRMGEITRRSRAMGAEQKELNRFEQSQRAVTNLLIELFSIGMLFFMLAAYRSGAADFHTALLVTVAMMGSFGPVVALSSLSNNLNQTLASGERVLRLLEEEPEVEEVSGGEVVAFAGAAAEQVSFSYGGEEILHDLSLDFQEGKILGIHGPSGSGKSTLLKLLMRFWDVTGGRVALSGTDVRRINTACLRNLESYVTQETVLFKDTIANNIAIGKLNATREEIVEAAKKAAVHDFIQSLPQGYDTPVGELGDTLSGGEKQRIGVARAFLHDAPLMLLDEPTSNLDALNEGVILRSLSESAGEKTVVLVSHRESTMNIADTVFEMSRARQS